jgi:hypothetical protein
MTGSGSSPGREPSIAELQAEADHARDRVALYRRKLYAGRGETRRMAELEREAAGAAGRLARAKDREA